MHMWMSWCIDGGVWCIDGGSGGVSLRLYAVVWDSCVCWLEIGTVG